MELINKFGIIIEPEEVEKATHTRETDAESEIDKI